MNCFIAQKQAKEIVTSYELKLRQCKHGKGIHEHRKR